MPERATAIIGLACRFPGKASSVASFWKLLCVGESAWSGIPEQRFRPDAYWSDPSKSIQGAHFLVEDVSRFDAAFFRIPATEASTMDPQHRLMLEVAYEALESAGLSLEEVAGTRTGVFMAHFTSDYKNLIYRDPDHDPPFAATGLQATSLANRLSWLWDLRGPSLVVDTACSSSLVAVHLACLSIQNGECDTAIVGGSNLLLSPDVFLFFAAQGFLSPDGKSKTFDASADGYGRGEGVACVILRRMDHARLGRDRIRAVLCASACNQDGGQSQSFTSPSAEAQERLIREAYHAANLDVANTGYVEAHGTGTQAGDTIETRALAGSIAAGRKPSNRLLVGSVKASIGHLEAAAGLASLIKSVLILENGVIPPNINLSTPNPKIPFDVLSVPTQLLPFPYINDHRQISLNSFGFGGTNCHVILQDLATFDASHKAKYQSRDDGLKSTIRAGASDPPWEGSRHPPHSFRADQQAYLFPLQAHDRDGIALIRSALSTYIQQKHEIESKSAPEPGFIRDLAYTLSRRSRLQWRAFAVASSPSDLLDRLTAADKISIPDRIHSQQPRIGFIFTGQGSQWPTMGVQLRRYAVFRKSIDDAEKHLISELGCTWSVIEELQKDKANSRLGQAEFSQSLCTVLQVATVELLASWGIRPSAVCGHSSGEIAAAYASGAISRTDAWTIGYCRGQVASNLKTLAPELDGAMAAVGASAEYLEQLFGELGISDVCVACQNSPASTTISGDRVAVEKLVQTLAGRKIFARQLRVDKAYHSSHMLVLQEAYLAAMESVGTQDRPLSQHTCEMYSSVTCSLAEPDELGPGYWVRNLVSPVLFAGAVQELLRPSYNGKPAISNAVDVLIEVGPHPALESPTLQSLEEIGVPKLPYFSPIVRDQDAVITSMTLAGSLMSLGTRVDLVAVNGLKDSQNSLASLLTDAPSYPWNHSHTHWAESRLARQYRQREKRPRELLGSLLPSASAGLIQRRVFLDLSKMAWIADHKILGSVLFPGAGYLVMAIEAAIETFPPSGPTTIQLKEVHFLSALQVPATGVVECTIALQATAPDGTFHPRQFVEFAISSFPNGTDAVRNCVGAILLSPNETDQYVHAGSEASSGDALLDASPSAIDPDAFYTRMTELGLEYGPKFAVVKNLSNQVSKCSFDVAMSDMDSVAIKDYSIIHPTVLDAVVHAGFAALKTDLRDLKTAQLPSSIDSVTISLPAWPQPLAADMTGSCTAVQSLKSSSIANFSFRSIGDSHVTVLMDGFHFREVPAGSTDVTPPRQLCFRYETKPDIRFLDLAQRKRILQQHEGGSCDKLLEVSMVVAYRLVDTQLSLGALTSHKYISMLHFVQPDLSIAVLHLDDKTNEEVIQKLQFSEVLKTARCSIYWPIDGDTKLLRQKLLLQTGTGTSDAVSRDVVDFKAVEADVLLMIYTSDSTNVPVKPEDLALMTVAGGSICLLASSINTILHEYVPETAVLADGALSIWITPQAQDAANGHKVSAEVTFVRPKNSSDTAGRLERELQIHLEEKHHRVLTYFWDDTAIPTKRKACVISLELTAPMLSDLSEAGFDALKSMIADADSIFWLYDAATPFANMIEGFARTVRNEQPGLIFRTIGINWQSTASLGELASRISDLISAEKLDQEYAFQDGMPWIKRILQDVKLSKSLVNSHDAMTWETQKMLLSDIGSPFDIVVSDDQEIPVIAQPLILAQHRDAFEDDQAEVEVEAGLVWSPTSDDDDPKGRVPVCLQAGVVSHTGPRAESLCRGDRVVVCGDISLSSHFHTTKATCVVIPEAISTPAEAIALGLDGGLAWHALIQIGQMSPGHLVLIQDAPVGFVRAAAQLAQHRGVEFVASLTFGKQSRELVDNYGIDPSMLLDSSSASYQRSLMSTSKGRGFQIVLQFVSVGAVQSPITSLAPQGRLVYIGDGDALQAAQRGQTSFRGLQAVYYIDPGYLLKAQPALAAEMMRNVFGLVDKGVFTDTSTTSSDEVVAISQLKDEGGNLYPSGSDCRLIVTLSAKDSLPVMDSFRSFDLDSDAAYVLVGGFGGIGRSLATLLADMGAKKICFFSRSGPSTASAQQLVQELEARDVQVRSCKCDIASAEAVQRAIDDCTARLGPIKGIVQSTMVLRDALLSKMTYTEWKEAIASKVQGTWNLHAFTANVKLDFFVMLSSFAGIFGNRGQANYNAGNTFQDALAHFRHKSGLPAVSVDLGIMVDIGHLAETGMLDSLQGWAGPFGITEAEFKVLIKSAIFDKQRHDDDMAASQIITGLGTGGSAQVHSIDLPFYLEEDGDPRFSILALLDLADGGDIRASDAAAEEKIVRLADSLPSAPSLAQASALVNTELKRLVARIQMVPLDEVDEHRSLAAYGISSLDAVTFVGWSAKEARSKISLFDVLSSPSIATLAATIAQNSELVVKEE